ncbi:hypothetical protein A9W97_17600 [Mycobacterium gordonae]|nr:hypothetical protein A9W97_17600 [Mycobacterium gordonae]
MMIGIASVLAVAGIWFFGIWLGHLENMEHPPRYEGFERFPRCVGDFAALDGHGNNAAGQSHRHRHMCIR